MGSLKRRPERVKILKKVLLTKDLQTDIRTVFFLDDNNKVTEEHEYALTT